MDGDKQRRSATPRSRGKLAPSIAHEINNPLDALVNLLYLMEHEAAVTEKGYQYLQLAREEVGRISQIVHAAMDELRDGAGRSQLTNVPELLLSVVDFYRSRLESHGISIRTRCCLDGDVPIYAGPMRRAFANLLLNAADSMPKGGRLQARVAAAHEWTGQQRRGIRVTFADDGCGIAAHDLPRILHPFFTTKGCSGNGIGLSLVRETVQKHGGAIRVRSSTKPGHSGSIFSIFLPAV